MPRWTGSPPGKTRSRMRSRRRHLAGGTLVLYDVSSAAFEGRTCPLGAIGHPKDGVRGRLQIVYGLLTSTGGVPVAIEVFAGQHRRPRDRRRPGEQAQGPVRPRPRGARRRPGDADRRAAARGRRARRAWTGSPRCAPPRSKPWSATARCSCRCSMRWTWPRSAPRTFPASGWSPARTRSWKPSGPANARASCRPPKPTWRKSPPLPARERRPLRGTDQIALRADRVLRRRKVAKHFTISHRPRTASATPATRTPSPPKPPWTASTCCAPASSPAATWDSGEVVASYKALAQVERAFRALNTDLDIRPIRHRTEHPGPRPRVLADAVVLPQLAHAGPPRAHAVHRRRQASRPSRPAPAPSPPPPAPRGPWPKPPPSAPPTTSQCTASPACWPTWPPSASTRSSPPTPPCPPSSSSPHPHPSQRQALDLLGVSHRLGTA